MANGYAKYSGFGGGGSGTVISVGLSDLTNTFNITGSPVTNVGVLTLSTFKSQSANTFLAAPNGSSGSPTFRLIVSADISPLFGNLTDVGTDGITITGGTSAVLGSGTSISQHVADTTHNGYLASTDWNTFNNKQPAGNYITALTGDVTAAGPGSAAATLATVNANVGSFGTASSVGSFTVNAKGLVTAASNTSIQIAESQVTNLVSDLAGKLSTALTSSHIFVGNASNLATDTAMSGDATLANTGALTLATVNANVGSFGSSTSIPSFTVNAKGLITAASGNVVIAPAGTLTGTTLASNVVSSSLTSVGTLTAGTWNASTITVPYGGTGDTSFTAYSPIAGGTTSTGALQSISNSGAAAGYVLTYNSSSSLPTWQASSGSSGSGVTFKTHAAGGEAPGANNPIIFTNLVYDTNSGYNSGTGQYIIPSGQGGYWKFGGTFQISGSAPGNLYVSKNGSIMDYLTTAGQANVIGDVFSGWTEFNVSVGDAITWQTDSNDTFSGVSYLIATKIAGATTSLTIAALDSGVANSNGLYLTGSMLSTQSASSSNPGMVNLTSQTFAGSKNFTSPIGYNNTTPSAAASLDIINTTGATQRIVQTGYGGQVGMRGRYANGTLGSPTAATAGNILSFISGMGYGASTFPTTSTAAVNIVANETFTNTSNASYIQFSVTPTGSVTTAEAARVNSTGNVLIGTTTDSGTQKLQINGNSNVGTVTAGTWNGTQTSGNSFLTTGTTYTTPAGITSATLFKFTLIGGGGGGGGINTAAAAGAGGGAGGTVIIWATGFTASTAYTVAIGTAGSAGTGTPAAGGNGGSTTITFQSSTYTAGGGTGGGDTATSNGAAGGSATNSAGTGVVSIMNIVGGGGGSASGVTTNGGGQGGNCLYGYGGAGIIAAGAGQAGTGYGGGGSGGKGAAAAGGAGAAGAILVEWQN
jgi:hypothetical protein